jgi:L,D-transpeptidase-like protein
MKLFTQFSPSRIWSVGLAGVLMAVLSNCSTVSTGGAQYSTNYDPPAHRPQNPQAVHVKVSTSREAVYVMEGDRVLMATPCSVGKPEAPTKPGHYHIYAKTFDRRSHSFKDYPMPHWCEFDTAYGFHWGFVKPYPCTHGCIRLPKMAAAKFYAMVSIGTPVDIAHAQPEDATVGTTLPRLDDSTLPDPPDSYMMSNQVFEDAKYRGQMFVD